MAPALLPELFVMIFSYLQKAELKPLRFVGRMFNDLIITFLFDKIYISPQYLNLSVFRNISHSPYHAKHVKELVYDATEFSNDNEEKELGYQQLAMDQEKLISSEEDLSCLCTGLMLMPNIKSVVIMDSWDVGNVDGLISGNSGPLSRTFSSLKFPPLPPWRAGRDESPEVRARSHRVFWALIRALSRGNYKVHELKYSTEDTRYCLPLHIFDQAEADLQHMINVFQHLRRISLALYTYGGRLFREWFFKRGNVARILLAAVNLEALELHFDRNFGVPSRYQHGRLFGKAMTWPRLKHLVLSFVHVGPKDYMDFLSRHRTSLQYVELAFILIVGKEPEEVFSTMRDCLQLERFRIDEKKILEVRHRNGAPSAFIERFVCRAL